jgi:hypothetical protein
MLELVGKLTKNSINRIETIKDELPHLSNREIKIPLSEADSLSARAILFQAAALGDLGSLTEYQNITFPNHKQLFNLISKDLKDEATFWIQIAKYARIKSYPNPPDTEELQFQDLGKQMSQMYSTSRSIAASFKALEKSTINIGNDYDKNFSESIKKIRDAKETFTLSILGFFGSIILLISIAYWAISTGIKDTPKADNTIEVKKSENLEIS